MNQVEEIIANLKLLGLRRTRLRAAVLEILLASPSPLSVAELQDQLALVGLTPNKTSLYRELETLLENEIAEESTIAGTRKVYMPQSGHHHHAVCTSCRRTECIELPEVEEILRTQPRNAAEGFSIRSHDLTLYGLCRKCTT
jgi:Fur family ferric uptake transcriptional regulator